MLPGNMREQGAHHPIATLANDRTPPSLARPFRRSRRNRQVEILNAVEPGLATTGGPLILASSPHARRGVLWEVFKRHYGEGGDPLILVAHVASRTLNPSLPQRVGDRALEKDRSRATAEYLAEFRTDIAGFVALEVVESCVGDHREILPAAGVTYRAFVDPSGGSDHDARYCAQEHKATGEKAAADVCARCCPTRCPCHSSPEQATSNAEHRKASKKTSATRGHNVLIHETIAVANIEDLVGGRPRLTGPVNRLGGGHEGHQQALAAGQQHVTAGSQGVNQMEPMTNLSEVSSG